MNDDEYLKLRKAIDELRSESPDSAEAFLNRRFSSAKQDLLSISSLLSEHYALTGNVAAQEWHRRLGTILSPEEPLAWSALTEFLIFTKENLDEADLAAQRALKCAEKTGDYIRLCHNNFARIARRRGDYEKLKEHIRFLTNFTPGSGKRDIHYEMDFLVGIERTKFDGEILENYEAIAKK